MKNSITYDTLTFPELNWLFQVTDYNAWQYYINVMPFISHLTFTEQGLAAAKTACLEVNNRPGFGDVVILATDGMSKNDVKTPADALRAMEATVFVVGVGLFSDAQKTQALEIAGGDASKIFLADDYNGLGGVVTEVVKGLCSECQYSILIQWWASVADCFYS